MMDLATTALRNHWKVWPRRDLVKMLREVMAMPADDEVRNRIRDFLHAAEEVGE